MGGQFAPKKAGHFESKMGGHFKTKMGGQYERYFQLNQKYSNLQKAGLQEDDIHIFRKNIFLKN